MFDKTKNPQGANLALYPSRGTASVDWSSWVSVNSSRFIFLLGSTNSGGIKCPVDLTQVTPVTRNTVLWITAKTLLVCCFSLKFRCVYAAQQWCQSCCRRKSLQDYAEYAHNRFVDCKRPCHLFSSKVSRFCEWKTFGIGDVNIFQPLPSSLLFSSAKGFNPVCYRRLLRQTHDVCQCQSELSFRHKTTLEHVIFYFVRILSCPVLLLLLHLTASAGPERKDLMSLVACWNYLTLSSCPSDSASSHQ
jgi:hypothetical protein